jgi:hypothetical protein
MQQEIAACTNLLKSHSFRPFSQPVGAAEGCDLLTLLFKGQDQKIAAFGSSYNWIYGVLNGVVQWNTH